MKKGMRKDCGVEFGLVNERKRIIGVGCRVGFGKGLGFLGEGLGKGLNLYSSNKPGFVNRNINGNINRGLGVELLKGGL